MEEQISLSSVSYFSIEYFVYPPPLKMWDVTATYYPMIPTWISELESMRVYILLFWYPQHQRWDNILKNIEKPIYWSYRYWYWYWNLQFQNIDIDIDIEICLSYILLPILILKNMNIDIGIDIDIGEIKSIFVDFYGIFTGLTYSIFKTNFVQLPLWFCQKLEYLLEVFIIPLI